MELLGAQLWGLKKIQCFKEQSWQSGRQTWRGLHYPCVLLTCPCVILSSLSLLLISRIWHGGMDTTSVITLHRIPLPFFQKQAFYWCSLLALMGQTAHPCALHWGGPPVTASKSSNPQGTVCCQQPLVPGRGAFPLWASGDTLTLIDPDWPLTAALSKPLKLKAKASHIWIPELRWETLLV